MDFNEHFYEILFGAIREGLILVNSKGEIEAVNQPANNMFGYADKELIGQSLEVLIPPGKRTIHKKERTEYNKQPKARLMGANIKLDGVRKDGIEFPVQVSLNPFVDSSGERLVVALISDITERRENEIKLQKLRETLEHKVKERTQKLRESEQMYKSISRNFPSGIISIFDRSYKYLFAEGKGLYELGLETSDLIGIDFLERIDKKARKTVKFELDKAFEGEAINFELNVRHRTYLINAVPLHNDENKVDRILVVEQNITPQKEVAKKLEETLRQERELTEMKSRFVSMASHEFRTPLTTINSSAGLIKKYYERESYERIVKHADRIKNSVNNLNSILNDFLSFEKLEANKVNTNFKYNDLPSILHETFDEMQGVLSENQSFEYHGPEKLELKTDAFLLKNTILNLLSNAVKYSKKDGKIIVSLQENEKNVLFSIQDFGLGIPKDDQKNLFTRFFRAGNVTNIEGTGLGLNIVLRYLELLKGEISFQSEKGVGTTFFITLPKI